jgi:tRNA threonylcarbamoyladenosine biosynthesis protein TsaE
MSDEQLNNISKPLIQLVDEQAMTNFGAQLAAFTVSGTVIYLDGDLGAGKTTLVRGFLRSLGYLGAVKSPTFTVVEPYSLDYNKLYDYNELGKGLKLENQLANQHELKVYHFDLYRLEDPEELEYLGIRDYFDGQAIALIEWPEKGLGVLPEADVHIKINYQKQGRQIELTSLSSNGAAIVSNLFL